MKQNSCFLIFLVCGLWGTIFAGCSHEKPSSPNVIFIILDAARADHFSAYGYGENTTPYMDRIGKQGVIFLKHFANATHTPESVPKFLFSRYYSLPISRDAGPNFGIKRELPGTLFKKYDEQQILLPEVLSNNGYQTMMIHTHGWFDKYSYMVQKFDEDIFIPYKIKKGKAPWDDEIITELNSWLEDNKEKFFFIYCHIMSPHSPYPAKESDAKFLAEVSNSERDAIRKISRKSETGGSPGKKWNKREIMVLNGLYDSNLNYTDKWIGEIYDKLKELDLEDRTLIIITADHGEMLGEHNSYGHHKPQWDPQIHIPLIMHYPPLIPENTRVAGLTESVDIMPTILNICGISLPTGKTMDGVNLLDYIHQPTKTKKAVFTETSVRTKDYKYIMKKGGMLYDLNNDPEENTNIIDKKPEIKRQMKELHLQSMAPYKDRYENSIRDDPPDHIFYLSIDNFRITPQSAYETLGSWKANLAGMPWVLIENKSKFGLYCIPDKGDHSPLTITAPVQDGIYRISILLESSREILVPPEDFGFKYKFDKQNSFQVPLNIELFKRSGSNRFFYYIDLGETNIKDNNFHLQFQFSPHDDQLYIIRHVKFIPEGLGEPENKPEIIGDDEKRIRMNNLKALGYMQ